MLDIANRWSVLLLAHDGLPSLPNFCDYKSLVPLVSILQMIGLHFLETDQILILLTI